MDIQKIKKLIQIIESSTITEIDISDGKEMLRMKRILSQEMYSQVIGSKKSVSLFQQQKPEDIVSDTNNNKNFKILKDDHVIRSPIVGVFYSTPSPGMEPFVSIGQVVRIGDVVCIIEAMKIMNHIQSDKNGLIKDILIENGQPVEFNEPLIIIE